ncbi:taurine dioxygenase [Pseudogulbenkiania ferrooxidans]|uniref:Alpha-ketoglutarate-dependent taurine dioxygenase n=1 Tax=Pseudogulbenkiania ferrooxidans EGD-HP2 TaxID=1388764 RepID=A0ABP2XL16_9NEIS|nr:taurine dioxygenase [Pseudogulbenkiania ferrooxidans]ERE06437.1 alpha-ketoglutarate-dependent taurine dioxygenase [Pseudogulbenkiania ferrooxidans EGD-HP2]
MNLQLIRLSPALGAVVEGIDLARPLDDERHRALNEALLRHQVLFFRSQDITPLQQRNFAVRFGDLHTHPIYPQHPDAREIVVLDTDVVDLQDNAIWHTDVTFIETPPLGAVLAARQLPELGGDTLWASGIAAYEALSASLKARLEGLSAVHDFAKSFPLTRYGLTDDDRRRWDETRRKHPPISHPLVRIHPESGRRALFVSEGFTVAVNDLPEAEGQALLQFLFAHQSRPEFSIRWRWQPGDVAFWDNRCTIHYAVDDYRPARRVMHRATILGDRPY